MFNRAFSFFNPLALVAYFTAMFQSFIVTQSPSNPFNAVDLTNVINLMPNQYSKVFKSGLFPFVGMETDIAMIARLTDAELCLVPMAEWCAPAKAMGKKAKRELIQIPVPHTPIYDSITTCDTRGKRSWDLNTENGLMSINDEANKKQAHARMRLEQTIEFRCVRALYGEILDADGSVYLDLFNTFKVTPVQFEMKLSDADFDLRAFVMKLKRQMEKNFKGNWSRIEVMLDSDTMDLLTGHPKVTDIYKRCCDTQSLLTTDVRSGFEYAGVVFWEYTAQGCITKPDGTNENVSFVRPPVNPLNGNFVAGIVGVAYPVGTTNTFELLGAPPTNMDYSNQLAQQIFYTSIETKCHNQGYDILVETNVLPIMKQPGSLLRIKRT